MSNVYTVQAPQGSPQWCKVLTQSISTCLKELTAELTAEQRDIKSSVLNIEAKFDHLSQRILDEVNSATVIAKEALDIAQEAKQDVLNLNNKFSKIEQEHEILKIRYNGLRHENVRLQTQQDAQESYSRRDNLLIRGITDDGQDDDKSCMRLVRDFFVQKLKLSNDKAESIVFVRCHRIGKKSQYKRQMIVRFQYFADRQFIWDNRYQLKNTSFSLSENFASEVEYKRRLLYPILSTAKRSHKYDKVYLNGDVLRISGRDYSVEDIGNLPKDLHPNNFAVKQNEQWLIFGGIHSRYYFLSNFYKVPLTYKNIEFEDLETAYQYAKASTFNDHVSCENILCSTSPSAAKRIGGSIKNFKSKDWDKVKQDIMLELLRIKFIPGSDLAKRLVATSGKSLAEAGQSGVYSIGMTLNNKELFDTQKWTKNVLGELLMKVRQELM